jgi:hypothetical protein
MSALTHPTRPRPWVRPAADSAPACIRMCSKAWRSRRPRALRR